MRDDDVQFWSQKYSIDVCRANTYLYIRLSLGHTLSFSSPSECECVRVRAYAPARGGWVGGCCRCVCDDDQPHDESCCCCCGCGCYSAVVVRTQNRFLSKDHCARDGTEHHHWHTHTYTNTHTHTQAHIRTRGRRHRYLCNSGHRAVHHQHHPTSAHARTGTALIRRGCVCV